MDNLNKLCHSLGSLESQICSLNANFSDLKKSLLNISKRVGVLENKYAMWRGKVIAILGVATLIGYFINLATKVI